MRPKPKPRRGEPASHPQRISFDVSNSVPVYSNDVIIDINAGAHTAGSSNVRAKCFVNHSWDTKVYVGSQIALDCSGNYLAYALDLDGDKPGAVRVTDLLSGGRGLVRDIRGPVKELDFSSTSNCLLLAAVDAYGDLYVYNVSKNERDLSLHPVLNVTRDHIFSVSEFHRVSWCALPGCSSKERVLCAQPDTKFPADASTMLLVTHDDEVQIWDARAVSARYGSSPRGLEKLIVAMDNLRKSARNAVDKYVGFCSLPKHEGNVLQAVFSSDGTMVATASQDGKVRFFSVSCDSVLPRHEWIPHDNRSLSCLLFLDDPLNSESIWNLALTGAEDNRELKLWRCQDLSCLQVITFVPPPSLDCWFKVEMDPKAKHIVMSDIHRRTLYALDLYHDDCEENPQSRICAVSELPLAAPYLSFKIRRAISTSRMVNPSGFDQDSECEESLAKEVNIKRDNETLNSRKESVDERTVSLKLFAVEPKGIQECTIEYSIGFSELDRLSHHDESIAQDTLPELQLEVNGHETDDGLNNKSVITPPQQPKEINRIMNVDDGVDGRHSITTGRIDEDSHDEVQGSFSREIGTRLRNRAFAESSSLDETLRSLKNILKELKDEKKAERNEKEALKEDMGILRAEVLNLRSLMNSRLQTPVGTSSTGQASDFDMRALDLLSEVHTMSGVAVQKLNDVSFDRSHLDAIASAAARNVGDQFSARFSEILNPAAREIADSVKQTLRSELKKDVSGILQQVKKLNEVAGQSPVSEAVARSLGVALGGPVSKYLDATVANSVSPCLERLAKQLDKSLKDCVSQFGELSREVSEKLRLETESSVAELKSSVESSNNEHDKCCCFCSNSPTGASSAILSQEVSRATSLAIQQAMLQLKEDLAKTVSKEMKKVISEESMMRARNAAGTPGLSTAPKPPAVESFLSLLSTGRIKDAFQMVLSAGDLSLLNKLMEWPGLPEVVNSIYLDSTLLLALIQQSSVSLGTFTEKKLEVLNLALVSLDCTDTLVQEKGYEVLRAADERLNAFAKLNRSQANVVRMVRTTLNSQFTKLRTDRGGLRSRTTSAASMRLDASS
ncbi:unnamed protein product [Notodromas monacha]|uniref:Enhancer of mRNA-decapping protein 4 n=1 Tax=Notodromas monacha TaxID=399045 RepID=A0A7R9BCF4_9CRUS|nr:unnamed protein product [Notodromas monacha]CAG0912684.1 unnamed protein product [Notodromas monacha]